MNEKLKVLLENLLDVLDIDRQDEIEDLHKRALNWEYIKRLPVVMTYPLTEELLFQPYSHSEVFDDPEKMLFNELVYAFKTSIASRSQLNDDLPCTVRADFGTVVIASMFGAHIKQVDENPPWVVHNDGHDVCLETVLNYDPMDFSKGWCPRIIEMYRFYQDVFEDYPDLKKIIMIVLPDLQSPFDNLELIIGSDLFAKLHTNVDSVRKALEVVSTVQVNLARHLMPYLSEQCKGFSHQHVTMIKGNILLRNDSVIMMSPEMYRDQIACHDERVLREMDGGGVHACGKIESHVSAFMELTSVRCLDIGQPKLNNLDVIYKHAKENHVPLVRVVASEEELVSGAIMRRFPTGVTLRYQAQSLTDAKRVMNAYRQATDKQRN